MSLVKLVRTVHPPYSLDEPLLSKNTLRCFVGGLGYGHPIRFVCSVREVLQVSHVLDTVPGPGSADAGPRLKRKLTILGILIISNTTNN